MVSNVIIYKAPVLTKMQVKDLVKLQTGNFEKGGFLGVFHGILQSFNQLFYK